VTFETDDNYSIRFEISNNSSTIRFDSKWKKTLFAQHYFFSLCHSQLLDTDLSPDHSWSQHLKQATMHRTHDVLMSCWDSAETGQRDCTTVCPASRGQPVPLFLAPPFTFTHIIHVFRKHLFLNLIGMLYQTILTSVHTPSDSVGFSSAIQIYLLTYPVSCRRQHKHLYFSFY